MGSAVRRYWSLIASAGFSEAGRRRAVQFGAGIVVPRRPRQYGANMLSVRGVAHLQDAAVVRLREFKGAVKKCRTVVGRRRRVLQLDSGAEQTLQRDLLRVCLPNQRVRGKSFESAVNCIHCFGPPIVKRFVVC